MPYQGPQPMPQLEPGRWWKALDAEGNLLAESSNEREIRGVAVGTPGATLHRFHRVELGEWRRVIPK